MTPPITAERILSLSAPLNSVSVRWLFQQLVGRPFDEIGPETADIAYLIYNTLTGDGRTERVEIDPVDGKKDYIYSRQIEATGRPDTLPDRSAQQILAQAASAIDQRAASRDLPNERSMARAVGAFNVLAGKSMSETEGWLFMAILKASRATAGTHHPDDYTDGASYFALAGESAAAEEAKSEKRRANRSRQMKISEILKAGAVTYTHHYMQTMVGEEICTHTLHPPKQLLTLAARHPDAEVVEFGDGTLGIEVGGNLWAAENPHKTMRPAKAMPHEVWQYCTLAMGGDCDTHARRH